MRCLTISAAKGTEESATTSPCPGPEEAASSTQTLLGWGLALHIQAWLLQAAAAVPTMCSARAPKLALLIIFSILGHCHLAPLTLTHTHPFFFPLELTPKPA